MYLIDYHVHTKRCGHACGEDREYVETAIRNGLKEIGFSDHVPRFYESNTGKVTERGMQPGDLDDYVTAVNGLKAEYREITIKLGLEIDYVPGWEKQIEAITRQYPWDYVLGAVHFIPDWNFGYIGYDKEHNSEEIFSAYWSLVARAAESGLFDILAHIDLPRRFFVPPGEEVMAELCGNLAVRLGKAGSVIEMNTYGIRSAKQGDIGILPGQYLLRLCRQHGVAVTAGSDAHKPEEVGADFERAEEMLSKVGYDRITTFQRRRAAQVRWGE